MDSFFTRNEETLIHVLFLFNVYLRYLRLQMCKCELCRHDCRADIQSAEGRLVTVKPYFQIRR